MESEDKIVSKNKVKREVMCIVACFLFSVVMRGLLADFPKMMFVYHDEATYLSIARNLFYGRDFFTHFIPNSMQKILYPAIISPVFLLESAVSQVRAIGWINSIVLSSSVFPMYFLGKKMFQDKKWMYVVLLFTIMFPTMVYSIGFMSEVMYLPVALWTVYAAWEVFSVEDERKKLWFSILFGFFAYLTFLTKEIGLYLLVAYLGVEFFSLFLDKKSSKKNTVLRMVLMIITFVIFHVVIKLLLQNMSGDGYVTALMQSSITIEQIEYLILAMVLNVMFTVLAVGVFPVIIPLSIIKKCDKPFIKFFVFLIFSLVIGCAVTSYMITLKEDFGMESPRVHMRYLEPLILPFVASFIYAITKYDVKKKSKWLTCALWVVFSIILIFVVKGIGISAPINHTALGYFESLCERFQGWHGLEGSTCTRILIVLFGSVLVLFLCKSKKLFVVATLVCLSTIFLSNNVIKYNYWKMFYAVEEERVAEVDAMKEYIDSLDGNILAFENSMAGINEKVREMYDTYIDTTFYSSALATSQSLGYLTDMTIDLNNEVLFGDVVYGGIYEDLKNVDYIFTGRYNMLDKDTFEEVTDFPSTFYRLYKNIETTNIGIMKICPTEVGESIEIHAKDNVLYSQCKNLEYISEYKNQVIAYGPYCTIPKGTYRITFKYNYDESITKKKLGRVEVVSNGTVLSKKKMTLGNNVITLDDIVLNEDVGNFEFRMVAKLKGIQFESVIIERIE